MTNYGNTSKNMSTIIQSHDKKKQILQRTEPVNLSNFRLDDYSHYAGAKWNRTGTKILPWKEDEINFHCRVTMYQENEEHITFRHAQLELKGTAIIGSSIDGVPQDKVGEVFAELYLRYLLAYPDGMTATNVNNMMK